MPVFPPTRHSVIERLRAGHAAGRSEAFGDLVQGYWKPVYKYLPLRWRQPAEEAEDTTQAFFAEALEHAWFDRYEPEKARFRTFVRLCVDRLVMNAQQAAGRAKRGGGAEVLSIDFAGAEHELLGRPRWCRKPTTSSSANSCGRCSIAQFARCATSVSRAAANGTGDCSSATISPPIAARLCGARAELGLTAGQVTGYLAQVRRAFKTHTVAEPRTLCGSAEEFRREAAISWGWRSSDLAARQHRGPPAGGGGVARAHLRPLPGHRGDRPRRHGHRLLGDDTALGREVAIKIRQRAALDRAAGPPDARSEGCSRDSNIPASSRCTTSGCSPTAGPSRHEAGARPDPGRVHRGGAAARRRLRIFERVCEAGRSRTRTASSIAT